MVESMDDCNLKKAVSRVWGDEHASPLLKRRVEQLLATAPVAPARNWANEWGWAIAAALILCIGLSGWKFFTRPSMQGGETLSPYITEAMVARHDKCAVLRTHHGLKSVGPNDFEAIGYTMSAQLKIPVISLPLDQWKFLGASPCAVRGHVTAHLLYRNGNETLSIFSMPASSFAMKCEKSQIATDFVATQGTHHVAGFVKSDGFYCIVVNDPDGTMNAQQTRQLRDRLQNSFGTTALVATDAYPKSKMVVLTDLD
jgi:hypothetical protein